MKLEFLRKNKLLICKILLFVFAFVLAFMPATASRNLEVNSRVIVEMLGVDKSDAGLEITAQYATPSEADSTTKDKVTVKADSLTEAVEALDISLGRRVDLGQCSVVVVGAELDPEVLGTLLTATDVTADVYLTAAADKAGELVGDITEFMKKTGVTDADFIAYSAKRAHVATTTLLKFLSDLNSASHTAYLPVVEMTESGQGGGQSGGEQNGQSGSGGQSGQSGSGGQSSQSGQGGEKKEKAGMKVEKLAVYNESGCAGILERAAARGVAWASSPVENSIVVADVEYGGEIIRGVSGRLLKKRSNIRVNRESNSATVKLCVTIEPNGDKFNMLDSKKNDGVVSAVKKGFSKQIEGELSAAYSDSRELGCDPLFIAREFYRRAPDAYTDNILDGVEVKFEVDVTLK